MKKAKVDSLVRDPELYPRSSISDAHVRAIVDAIKAGSKLPPIKVDQRTSKIIDGYHRHEAHIQLAIEDIEVEVIKTKNDQEFFELAIEANAIHGLRYTPFERSRICLMAEQMGISLERVGHALKTPLESLVARKEKVFAFSSTTGGEVALKGQFHYKHGETLNDRQLEVNARAGGQNMVSTANQIARALDADMVNWKSESVRAALHRLYEALEKHLDKIKSSA